MAWLDVSFPIRRLVQDSRRVEPGDTFVACQGEHVDGRRFIPDALARGAASVVWDSEGFAWNDVTGTENGTTNRTSCNRAPAAFSSSSSSSSPNGLASLERSVSLLEALAW